MDDLEELELCPICDGEAGLLGHLGYRAHYACRNCGMQFSKDTRPVVVSTDYTPEEGFKTEVDNGRSDPLPRT